MGCGNDKASPKPSGNATAPSPAIAPGGRGRPPAIELDPRRIAEDLVTRFGPGGMDPRVRDLVPGFDAPFFQAGLAGYSDAAMRLIARRHGCPFCVTEALLDRTLLAGGRGFAKADLGDLTDNIPGGAEDAPLACQIMGSDPVEMAAASLKAVEQGRSGEKHYRALAYAGRDADFAKDVSASHLRLPGGVQVDAGHERNAPITDPRSPTASFSVIDVNLACPVKKVSKKARGGHWLAEPEGAIAILEAVREAVPPEVPVTVKMRRSFDDTDAMRETFLRLFDAAYDIGCAWVTVHGRTVEQKYLGPSRWDPLRELARRVEARWPDRVVFGSGDIWSAADIFRMVAYAGLGGASVARGCIGNPWIFRQARDLLAGREPAPPTVAEQRGVLEEHFDLAVSVNERLVRGRDAQTKRDRAELVTGKTMRKFAVRFSEHHPRADDVRRAFIGVQDLEGWRAVLDRYYAPGR
ncbi:MAG: tRNA-dihydrouridine synthase family protein [Planctomycetota bacterium]